LKINSLLAGTLAIVLVAGLVIPASAQSDANIDNTVQPAPLPPVATPLADETTIAFAPLAGPNSTPYTGHNENGFVVTSISGFWQESFSVGNPIPSIFHGTSNGAQAGVNIEKQGGGFFDLVSFDVGTGGGGTMDVTCTAKNQGNVVGNQVFQYSGGAFQTFVLGAGFSNIDSVDCTASNFSISSVNLDNFVLTMHVATFLCGPNTFESGGQCLPVAGLNFCGAGTAPVGGFCLPVSSGGFECGSKTMEVAGICLPDLPLICGDGTFIQNMMCFATSSGQVVGGYLIDINSASLFVAAIGVNPVITGLVGITIAGVAGQAVWFVHRRRKSENS